MRESQATSSAGPEDHVRRRSFLDRLAVDPRAQLQLAQVADLVERDQRRPAGRERVDRLAARPQRVLHLQVARADIVERHRTGEMGERVGLADVARRAPDHERELGLVVDAVRMRRGQHDVLAAADQRVGELREPHRRLGDLLAGLFGVVAVVEPDADDLLRREDRRVQACGVQRDPLAGRRRLLAELTQRLGVERARAGR